MLETALPGKAGLDHENAHCPRCGVAFHCGAREASCACARVQLNDSLRASIAQRYAGCLCGHCLLAVQEPGAV